MLVLSLTPTLARREREKLSGLTPSRLQTTLHGMDQAAVTRNPAFSYIPVRRQAVVLDTETTGVGGADRIVSLAAIPLDAGLRPSGPGVHLVFNPGRPSHPCAQAVHGLTDKLLARHPRFADHAEDIRSVFRGKMLVAHNLSFDLRMLAQEFTALGLPAPGGRGGRYCTMREFRARHAGQSAKLDLVLRRLGLPARAGQAHGAFEDAVLAMHVLHRLHHLADLHLMAPAPFQNAR